jgi:hypothetical protein
MTGGRMRDSSAYYLDQMLSTMFERMSAVASEEFLAVDFM